MRRPTSAIPRSASSPSSKPVLLQPQCDKRAFRPLLLDCWPASRIRVRIRCPRVLLRRPGPTPSTPLSMRKRESCLSLFPACLGSMCGCHRRQFSRFPNPRCTFSASAKWQLRQDISAAAPRGLHSHIDATRRLQEAATWNNVLRIPVAAGTAAGNSPRCLWSRTVDASETPPHQQCAQMHLSEDRRAGARGPGKAKRRVKITATCDDSGTGDLYNTPFQTLAEFSEILLAVPRYYSWTLFCLIGRQVRFSVDARPISLVLAHPPASSAGSPESPENPRSTRCSRLSISAPTICLRQTCEAPQQ